MKFHAQPLWAAPDQPGGSGTNWLKDALGNASANHEAAESEGAAPRQMIDFSAGAAPATERNVGGDIAPEDVADFSGHPEIELELESMADAIGASALNNAENGLGRLEKFMEIDARNTERVDAHIANLIEQERGIEERIQRDVILLMRTRKTRMGAEANSRILHSEDAEILKLLQSDPLNTANGAVRISHNGAVLEGGTKISFRSGDITRSEGEEGSHQTEHGGEGE